MSAIIVKDLVKRYGRFTAVQDVSFEVTSGQVTALLGPNGAGKTTTIEILEGFLAPTAGTVQVLGANPRSGGRAWRARIGLVLQTTSLDAQLTVAEALMMFGALYPKPRRVGEVLDLIDLTSDARTRIGALSGGQRRRVDLGLAIIGQPEMLFLDEPTTGLGHHVRSRRGGPGRMGGQRTAGLVLVLPVGPAPPGARTARGGTHHAPFGINGNGTGRYRLAADRPAACLQGLEEQPGLGWADGKLRDADREAG